MDELLNNLEGRYKRLKVIFQDLMSGLINNVHLIQAFLYIISRLLCVFGIFVMVYEFKMMYDFFNPEDCTSPEVLGRGSFHEVAWNRKRCLERIKHPNLLNISHQYNLLFTILSAIGLSFLITLPRYVPILLTQITQYLTAMTATFNSVANSLGC